MLERTGHVLCSIGPAYPSDARMRRALHRASASGLALRIVHVFVGAENLVSNGVLRVTPQVEHRLLLVPSVPLQRFEDGLGGKPLADEERQRGHLEGKAL